MRIPSGSTDRYIYFVAVDDIDFSTRETGLSSFTVYRSRNGGVAAAMTMPTINETDATNMPGVYELLVNEDTTIGASNDCEEMVFHITHAGMTPVTRTIELYRPKITEGETLTASSGVASANAIQISGDATAADNLETMLDGTGGQTLSLGQLNITRSDSSPNIVLGGSGAGNGIDFTRSGAGDPFDANIMAQINAEVDTAISDAALSTAAAVATVGANVDAILLDTGTDGVVISSATANQIADALLNRDFSSVSDTNERTLLNAARFLRNKYWVSGSILTVTKEDDTTPAWTSTLTTDAAADPVTGSDPA